ncbi:MAG: TIGR04282 family arsenosugar biosynthesis glycosyltransferase [Acidobacteriales bacterium]|nr:TIGR04282 family arsenosugar biosynthesis glycosyltransferase [Terriglobales bacterium]
MSFDTTICIFAKPPHPGQAKTRLIPRLGAEGAALVAEALLQDVLAAALSVPNANVILAVTEPFVIPGFERVPVWVQPQGDLGVRLEHILRRALSQSDRAIAIGADTPGLRCAAMAEASAKLRAADAVLGPTEDGGYYLIGLRRCPVGLFQDIRWSEHTTLMDTVARLDGSGLSYSLADLWFDLDTPEDLDCAAKLIDSGVIAAPQLSLALQALGVLQGQSVP